MQVPSNVVMSASLAMRGLSFAAFQLTRASDALPTLRWGVDSGVSDAVMDSALVYGRATSHLRSVASWATANDTDAARVDALQALARRVPTWQDVLLTDAGRVSVVQQARTKDRAVDPNDVLESPAQLPVMSAISGRLATGRSEALAGVRLLSDFLAANGASALA